MNFSNPYPVQVSDVGYLGPTYEQQLAHNAHKEQAMDALSTLLWTIWLGVPMLMSWKAGKNFAELTGSKAEGMERGAQALWRWQRLQWMGVFTYAILGWCWFTIHFTGEWMNFPNQPFSRQPIYPHAVPTMLVVGTAWTVLMWGVLYCRFAEFSLFRRGPIQLLWTVPTRALDGVHSWAIGLAAWLPALILPFFVFVNEIPV